MKRLPILAVAVAMLVPSSCVIFSAAKGIQTAFMSESDLGLAGDAFPVLIKVEEGLLAASPRDQATIVQTASLYVMYGNAFVQGPAEALPSARYEEKKTADFRARALYRRAFALLGPALERRAPMLLPLFKTGTPAEDGLPAGAAALLSKFGKKDIALLYWSSASILAAFAVDPLDMQSGSYVGLAKALLDRSLALDPAWDGGTLQELALSVYGSFPPVLGGDRQKALAAWERGLEFSKGGTASLYVTYANTICVPDDDYAGFKKSLEAALAIDPDARPETRLATTLAQERAKRMLANAGDYFLLP
jgi:predicted anti-sigma-YlaC factor YlaD